MSFDPASEEPGLPPPDRQNRSLVITSWVLLGLVCLSSIIPVFGFGSWLIAGPVLFIVLVMGIILLTRGETLRGLIILLTSLIAAPIFIFVAPFVSSLLGVGGTVAATGTTMDAASRATATSQPTEYARTPVATPLPVATPRAQQPAGAPPLSERLKEGNYAELKAVVHNQEEQIATLKALQLAAEGVQGYLTGTEVLNLEQRELVQRENVLRERIFELIGQRTGKNREEIAALFSELARNQTAPKKE